MLFIYIEIKITCITLLLGVIVGFAAVICTWFYRCELIRTFSCQYILVFTPLLLQGYLVEKKLLLDLFSLTFQWELFPGNAFLKTGEDVHVPSDRNIVSMFVAKKIDAFLTFKKTLTSRLIFSAIRVEINMAYLTAVSRTTKKKRGRIGVNDVNKSRIAPVKTCFGMASFKLWFGWIQT